MADIRKFAVEPTGRLHLRDASDELMYAEDSEGNPDKSRPMQIELYGPGSKVFARAQTENNNRLYDRMKKKGKSDQTAAEKVEESAAFFTQCTKGMSHIEYDQLQGAALFRAVYVDESIGFIAEQVNKYLGDWGNFTKASTTT